MTKSNCLLCCCNGIQTVSNGIRAIDIEPERERKSKKKMARRLTSVDAIHAIELSKCDLFTFSLSIKWADCIKNAFRHYSRSWHFLWNRIMFPLFLNGQLLIECLRFDSFFASIWFCFAFVSAFVLLWNWYLAEGTQLFQFERARCFMKQWVILNNFQSLECFYSIKYHITSLWADRI